jgi:hypothetical protein
VVGGIVLATVPGSAVQADGNESVAPNQTESRFNYSELRDGGPQLQDSAPSIRTDGQRLWWLYHWPADAVLSNPGEMSDSSREFVEPGGLVDRNSVWIQTSVVEGSIERTAKVVYWKDGEHGPEDIVVDEVKLQGGVGMPLMKIELRQSDEPRMVTVWIEGDEEALRWVFRHKSVATTSSIGISSWGDFLGMSALYFLLPIGFGSALSGRAALSALRRAGRGPGIPLVWWLFGMAVMLGVLLLWWFSDLAALLTSAPWIASLGVAALIFIVVLESQAINQRSVSFLRPDIQSTTSPSDESGADALTAAEQEETIVEMPDGRPAIVRNGITPFLARLFGAAAYVPSTDFQTRIKLPTSKKDELVLVDPEADTVLDYEPETLTWDLPEIEEWQDAIKPAGALLVIGAVSWSVVDWLSMPFGMVVFAALTLPLVLTAKDGVANVEPASAHTRQAWVTSMTLSQEVDDAKTLDEARKKIMEKQATTQRDIQDALETQDSTLLEGMFDVDVDRSLDESAEKDQDPLDVLDSVKPADNAGAESDD